MPNLDVRGFTVDDLRGRVQKGAALLDEKAPDWFTKIDPKQLRMSDCYKCVLAQVYGDFMDGLAQVFGMEAAHGRARMVLDQEHGFEAPNGLPKCYPILRGLWVLEVNERLAAVGDKSQGV